MSSTYLGPLYVIHSMYYLPGSSDNLIFQSPCRFSWGEAFWGSGPILESREPHVQD